MTASTPNRDEHSPLALDPTQRYVLERFERLTKPYLRALAVPALGLGGLWSLASFDAWIDSESGLDLMIWTILPTLVLSGLAIVVGTRLDRRLERRCEPYYEKLSARALVAGQPVEVRKNRDSVGALLIVLSMFAILLSDDVLPDQIDPLAFCATAAGTMCLGVTRLYRPFGRHWRVIAVSLYLLAVFWVLRSPSADSIAGLFWVIAVLAIGFALDARESLALLREVLGPSMSARDDLDVGTE